MQHILIYCHIDLLLSFRGIKSKYLCDGMSVVVGLICEGRIKQNAIKQKGKTSNPSK